MYSLFVNNSISSNNGSSVQLSMNPPISLDPNKKYYASVHEIDIVYCFPNIITGKNDTFIFKEMLNGTLTTFTCVFSQGIYSVGTLQNEINRWTQDEVQNANLFVLEPDESTSHIYIHFMTTTAQIVCTGSNNVMQILGYPVSTGILGPVEYVNDFYEGDKAMLNNIQNVYLLASFVNGGYVNGQSKNILASVTPDVAPYSTIMYRVQNPMRVPVCQPLLDNIQFQLTDQNNNPINMGITDPATYTPERWSARIIISEMKNDDMYLNKNYQ